MYSVPGGISSRIGSLDIVGLCKCASVSRRCQAYSARASEVRFESIEARGTPCALALHREKAGTVEGVHDVVENELGGGVMPCKYFGANAAWLRLTVISHNVMTALKRLALPAELLTARPKRLRFLLFNTPGRLVHHARKLVLRLAATAQRIIDWMEAARLLPILV